MSAIETQKALRAMLKEGPKTTADMAKAVKSYPQLLRYHLLAIGATPIRKVSLGSNRIRTVLWELKA